MVETVLCPFTCYQTQITICHGKLTYEVASGQIAKDYSRRLSVGMPFKREVAFADNLIIPLYSVVHCGSCGVNNAGRIEKMFVVWEKTVEDFLRLN